MTKVTLLGDSIRLIGYGKLVPSLLGDDFEVFQPDVNCKFAKFTYRGLYDWQNEMEGTQIVHWNNGLWDSIKNRPDPDPVSTVEEYRDTILRIAKYLKAKFPVVVFATTTPVRLSHPDQDNSRIEAYNASVVPELERMGVRINDLYTTVSADIDRFIRADDLIHLTEDGIKVCAQQTAQAIRAAAATLP